MTMRVLFPTVMKLECTTYITISECRSLPEVKQKIFEAFWSIMLPYSHQLGKHGHADHIILRDWKNVEVTDLQELKTRLDECSNFEVVFQDHPQPEGFK